MPIEPRPLSRRRIVLLTGLAMLAFAGNSLLCRLALKQSAIDAASFTSVRLVAGALVLAVILRARGCKAHGRAGNWPSALALFAYAAGFSWAYAKVPAASGALLLFGAVQITMIGHGLWQGERLGLLQTTGLLAACGGLVAMLLPGAHAAPPGGALLMVCAGVAWGIYSLRGRGAGDPMAVTAGNFRRASLFTVAMSAWLWQSVRIDATGFSLALASGAIASAMGYVIWYQALRGLSATRAATVQLSVPVITAVAAIVLLGEPFTLRLMLTSLVVLGGVALVILNPRPRHDPLR